MSCTELCNTTLHNTEPVAELLNTISPVGAQGEVVHGEGRVARGVTLYPGGGHGEVAAEGDDIKAKVRINTYLRKGGTEPMSSSSLEVVKVSRRMSPWQRGWQGAR